MLKGNLESAISPSSHSTLIISHSVRAADGSARLVCSAPAITTAHTIMKVFVEILDSFIHAFQLVARSVAFLLGIHLFIALYFAKIFSEPVEPTQRQRRVTVPVRRLGVFATHARHFSPARHLHLPALEPRPYEEPLERLSVGVYKHLLDHILNLTHKIKDQVVEMADYLETKGGKSGEVVTMIRKRGDFDLKPHLLEKLPLEITTHILMTAADMVPTKICLLSKRHHRLIVPSLYKSIQLSNPQIFHQFRMTIAVHNPTLGQHLEWLSVGSSSFDRYGYFPDALAESAALGVGLEQILITAVNLKHLYLDLFSLAALHDGTASRLQNGASPMSLSTEYAAPQYLSLPVFSKLQHIELSVFGLDRMAVEYLRQALPHIKSLTLRWVTRQSPGFNQVDVIQSDQINEDQLDTEIYDDSDGEGDMWSQGNSYQRKDFKSFVEALEALRLNVAIHTGETPGEEQEEELRRVPLEAITVLAWPNVMHQLYKYYRHDSDVLHLDSNEALSLYKDPAWNKSIEGHDEYSTRPPFDRRSTRRAINPTTKPESIPTPLRLAVDPMYKLGPRRGPLESWSNQ